MTSEKITEFLWPVGGCINFIIIVLVVLTGLHCALIIMIRNLIDVTELIFVPNVFISHLIQIHLVNFKLSSILSTTLSHISLVPQSSFLSHSWQAFLVSISFHVQWRKSMCFFEADNLFHLTQYSVN